jgi:Nif-specific regulatory protein
VVQDDRCSRHHAEIERTSSGWIVRDLASRNGTLVGGVPISGDHVLNPNDVIQVASCSMTFVHQLGDAPWSQTHDQAPGAETDRTMALADPHTITHRRREASWLSLERTFSPDAANPSPVDLAQVPGGAVAVQLFRLAFDLARQEGSSQAAQLALERILGMLRISAGGILLRRSTDLGHAETVTQGEAASVNFGLVATREMPERAYHRLSDVLLATLLREKQAILARNIQDDANLTSAPSSAARRTTSVIAAPIRGNDAILGVLHLYSNDQERMLEPDDLEIAIAVADTLAIALERLASQQQWSSALKARDRKIQWLESQLVEELELVGQSAPMLRIQQQVARVGPTAATVLIRGESGVGKELIARAIHLASPRSQGPFVAINCAALAPTLLESELFGHERGAFTGATERKTGKFELAHGGTLLLDEIGEMSPEMQAKFLRALEGKPFERLGGSKPLQVDVRVVAATNRDLEAAVKAGAFRADLYFRLRVIELTVPSLRQRVEDILPIAQHYLDKFRRAAGHGPLGFSPRAKKAMLEYAWPGNIRELRNAVERAFVLSTTELAEPEDLALSHLAVPGTSTPSPASSASEFVPRTLDEVERDHILATLAANDGHKSRTAIMLGVERSTLDRKLKKYGVDP